MLRRILAITGRPGLFKILSQGNNILLVEDLESGKRFPAHAREKLLSLGDIAMYTNSEEVPLADVLDKVYAYTEGKPVDVKELAKAKRLHDYFGEILTDFDRERVYASDIKKLFTRYNILLAAGFTSFKEEETDVESESAEETEAK